MIPYTLVRSDRRTVAIKITETGEVEVRAPHRLPKKQIEGFLLEKQGWIETHRAQVLEQRKNAWEPTEEERQALTQKAMELLPPLVKTYAERMGVRPNRITITDAKTRFGSCSSKNRICFSWRLMYYPQPAIEYVVVHELAHIKEKNHGSGFYKLVEQYMPDYREREKMLKVPPNRGKK